MAISPRFPAPRGGEGGSEGVETVSRGPRVDSNLPPPFLSTANRSAPTFERTVNLPTKWHSPRSVSLLPIPVTAEDDGYSRATPGPLHIYIYIYTSPTPTLPVPGQSNYFFLLFFPPLSPSFSSSPRGKKLVERVPLEIFTYTSLFSLFVRRGTYVS